MYIFVGLLYSEKRRKEIINDVKTSLESAANTYQWGLLYGLKENTKETIKIINSVPMGVFPQYSNILSERSCMEEENGFEINNIGYLNLPIIKQKQRKEGLYKRLQNIIKNIDEEITVVLYSLYSPYLKALHKLKKEYPNFQYIIIVPDVPCQYGVESPNKFKRWISRKVGYESLALSECADGYIFLTEFMNDIINKKGYPYEIIEGIASIGNMPEKTLLNEKPVILYTGKLDRVFGIGSLLDAYLKLPKDSAELWIAGGGDMQDEIKALSEKNCGVKFFGYCTKEEVFELQAKAWILVNPRSRKDEYTKYSFPSKTMEYLATGKPVVMNCLPGIPPEYAEHIFYFPEETPESMAETFQYILNLPATDLAERGEKQLEFIRDKKCGTVQAKKIVKLKEKYFNKEEE